MTFVEMIVDRAVKKYQLRKQQEKVDAHLTVLDGRFDGKEPSGEMEFPEHFDCKKRYPLIPIEQQASDEEQGGGQP